MLLGISSSTHAQFTADGVLSDSGISAADKQRILSGEFITRSTASVSDRGVRQDPVDSRPFSRTLHPMSPVVVTASADSRCCGWWWCAPIQAEVA